MEIRNNEDLRMFEKTIDACRSAVWLVTPDGKHYDLKKPMERYQGLGKLFDGKRMAEPEVYASCYEDEMNLFSFISDCLQRRAASAL